ncbi:MAG TPA: BamA/TamA family outer membrane protein [Gemmatimonadaceae bacterium]|jgi:outer membrane protein insertion porin family/translocation and assembly module TamA|nr:BamA/TamA family outer membrane protein [Gemmatimonadaceae bacterium]
MTAALLAIAPRLARAQGDACDVGQRELRSLDFKGNHEFRSSDLALRIATTPPAFFKRTFRVFGAKRCLDSDVLRLDVGRLRLFYRRHGYYNTVVDTAVTTESDGSVRLAFLITEGAPVLVDSLRIAGLDSITAPIANTNDLDLRRGVVFDMGRLQGAIDSIKTRLRDQGYPRADVAASYTVFDTLGHRARVSLDVIPGARAKIGQIRVRNEPMPGAPQRLGDETVRRLLGVSVGDEYNEHELADAQRALYQSDLFRHVEVGIAPDSAQGRADSLVTVDVVLRENYVRQLDTEVGWAVLDCFKGRAQLVDKNFLGEARRLELTAQVSKVGHAEHTRFANGKFCASDMSKDPFSSSLNYFVSGTFRLPTLFGLRGSPAISLYSERRGEYQAFLRTTIVGGEASITRDIRHELPLRLAYSLEFGRTDAQPALLCAVFNRCDTESRALLTERNRPLAVASAHLERLRADNALNPRAGTILRMDLRGAAHEIGSDRDLQFVKGLVDGSVYRGVTSGITLAARLRLGSVLGRTLSFGDSVGFIPPEERLYAGGASSVRGYQQNELGDLIYISERAPTQIAGRGDTVYFEVPADAPLRRVVPVGGNALIVANFEARLRSFFYPELIQYTAFLDAGDVWQRGKNLGGRTHNVGSLLLSGLRWTPGLGVRVFTPVGPFQANVGYNPYARPAGAIFYDEAPNAQGFAPLYCVSPGNRVPAVKLANGVYEQIAGSSCPATYAPAQSNSFFRRLTFTFSIGPDF